MIFIVGAHATGKTHLANIICRFNFTKIDLGPLLRTIHKESGSSDSFSEWIHCGEIKFGKNFTDDLIVNEIKKIEEILNNKASTPIDFIITGSRSVAGLKYILEHVGQYNQKENRVIFMDAPFNITYERYKKREGINITTEQFEKILDEDKKMGIENLQQIADFVIKNDSTSEKLSENILSILRNELKYKLSENICESKLKIR